jgi:Arc/MetJ family transcription regulator
MRTNIEIDDEVLAELMKELGIKTKREAVDFALRDTLRARRQLKALEAMRGSGWHGDEEEVRRNRYTVVA